VLLLSPASVFCIHTNPLALVALSSLDNMKFSAASAAVAAFAVNATAQTVSGAAEGFAAGVTGGGVRINISKMLSKF
jgi:hypothetical protein